jgi:L-alanine-DL-glutamate epimerase-like enolase superfamily enzyme
MRITGVETLLLRQPEVRLVGDGTQDVTIVRVHTDAGLTGTGEAHTSPYAARALIEAPSSHVAGRGLAEVIMGRDPLDIEVLWDDMYRQTMVFGRRGVAMHALSAIDLALWDIYGQATGLPLYRLLGGRRRARVRAYASILWPGTTADAVRTVSELAARGFTAVKLGWGGLGQDLRADVATVAALRRAVGEGVDLMIDVGQGMSRKAARRFVGAMEQFGVAFVEEPLSPDDLDGYRELGRHTQVPIACGEKETGLWGFRELIERGQLDIIQPDLARAGGITECRRIAALARLHHTTLIPHCWSTDILVRATLHFVACLPEEPLFEYCITDTPLRFGVTTDPIGVDADGFVAVPEEPGLGVKLHRETLERFRY